jgi:hypothetical protein
MLMMQRLKAVVGQGGAVVVRDRVDYPEGTELELEVHESEAEDELDDEELAALDAEIDVRKREYEATGKAYTAKESIAMLRARR